jgi:hypothetical protein
VPDVSGLRSALSKKRITHLHTGGLGWPKFVATKLPLPEEKDAGNTPQKEE